MINMSAKYNEVEPQRFSLYRVHKLISIYNDCVLDLWPLTSKINRVHPSTMAHMSGKCDEEAHTV